ncbi:hypothetical protein [Dactylosporangium sp. NPDC005555]
MSDNTPAPPPEVSRANRLALSEDWAATAVGLILLVLILAGVITKGLVP